MTPIFLSQSRFALVDDADYDALIVMGRWHANASGYAILYIQDSDSKRQIRYLHRMVMARVLGHAVGEMQVDHINADRLDCRRKNLRLASASQNQAAKASQANSSSGQKGVTLRSGKYDVRLRFYHHRLHLGRYADFELAVAVYGYAHRLLWQEFTSEEQGSVVLSEAVQATIHERIAHTLKEASPL